MSHTEIAADFFPAITAASGGPAAGVSNAASIAERWRAAREAHTARLIEIEGEANYAGLQRFLNCVSRLTRENRLLRYVYRAAKRD